MVLVIFILGVGYLTGSSYRKTKDKEVTTPEVLVPVEEIPENVSLGSVKEESGGFEIERGGLRAFPRDFPVYSGSLVASSWKVRSQPPFAGETVVWETNAAVSEVAEFYKNELEKAGWSATELVIDQSPATFAFEKGETKIHFWVGPEAENTVIQVTIATK